MPIFATEPVMASNPVASTSVGLVSLPPTRTALSVISSIGLALISTRFDVRLVEGREIIGVDADALGADRMAVGCSSFAVAGSLTISAILVRTKSAAVSLAPCRAGGCCRRP
jgi:hypothetical protein